MEATLAFTVEAGIGIFEAALVGDDGSEELIAASVCDVEEVSCP